MILKIKYLSLLIFFKQISDAEVIWMWLKKKKKKNLSKVASVCNGLIDFNLFRVD